MFLKSILGIIAVGFLMIGCNPTSPTEPAPVIIYSHTSATYLQNMDVASDTVVSTGGAVDSFTISPSVTAQTGLAFNKIKGSLSGTPTLSHPTTVYTIIAHGPGGTATATVSITITSLAATLEAHTWKLSGFLSNPAVSVTGTGTKHVDVYDSGITSCDKHSTQLYLSNGKDIGSHDSAATATGCGLPDSSSVWVLSGRIVTTTDADDFVERDSIVSISATQLKEITVVTGDDSPDNLTHTFTITSIAK